MTTLLACPTCANAFQEAGGDAAGWAILVMLLIIVPILACVGFLMIKMARREQRNLDPSLMDD